MRCVAFEFKHLIETFQSIVQGFYSTRHIRNSLDNFHHYFPAVWKCRMLPGRKDEELTYSYLLPFPDVLPVCVSMGTPAVSGETVIPARSRTCTHLMDKRLDSPVAALAGYLIQYALTEPVHSKIYSRRDGFLTYIFVKSA